MCVALYLCVFVCVLCLCMGLLTLGLCFFYLNEMTRNSPALFEKKNYMDAIIWVELCVLG